MFARANQSSPEVLFYAFSQPSGASGQEANLDKSNIYIARVKEHEKCAIKRYVTADCWHSFKELSPT